MGRISRAVVFFTILACTTGFDYGTKEWARSELSVDVAKPVIEGFWYWELAYNDGAAFSSLRGSQILLSLIAAAALVLLGVMAHKTRPEQHLKRVSLALVAGGAVGNLIDRIRDGAVTDFVRWRAGGYNWPIFNVADVALVIGVILLFVDGFLERRQTVQ